MKTGVGVLIFDVNRSMIGIGICNFGAGLESESQKRDSGHLWIEGQTSFFKLCCVITNEKDVRPLISQNKFGRRTLPL